MAKKKRSRATETYTVTRSGSHHKRRKHPVQNEAQRLKALHARIQADARIRKALKARRVASGLTPAEQQRKAALLGKDGKFKKGHPGKAKGQKDRVKGMRTAKASVATLIEEVVRSNPMTIRDALKRGLRAGPRHADRYLKLAAEYLDGKPVDTINVNSQYKQDELESAKRTLGKKLDKLFAIIVANRETDPNVPAES